MIYNMSNRDKEKQYFAKGFRDAITQNNWQHLNYQQLGYQFSVSSMAVHKWLSAKSMPNANHLIDISQKLSVPLEYLLLTKLSNSENIQLSRTEETFVRQYRQLSSYKRKIITELIIALN